MGFMVAPVGVGREGFRPLGRPFDRLMDLGRGPGEDRFLGIMENLGAEPAAHIRCDDPKLVLGDLQHEGAHQEANDMWVLGRGEERVLARRAIEIRNRRAGLHRVGDQPVVDQVDGDDMVCRSEGRVDGILFADLPIEAAIVWHVVMHERATGKGGVHIDDSRQYAVVDFDEFAGITCGVARGGDNDRHLVADIAHFLVRQGRVPRLHHRRAILTVDLPAARNAPDTIGRHIGAREDSDDAVGLYGLRNVDRLQGRMGVRRA